MAFKMVRVFFLTMRQLLITIPTATEGRMDIEETHYGVCFQYGKTSLLSKKLLLSGLFDFMLYKMDIMDPQESDC